MVPAQAQVHEDMKCLLVELAHSLITFSLDQMDTVVAMPKVKMDDSSV
jgi:hypothetical protein